MHGVFSKPLNWAFAALGLLVAAMTAFVVFQPVKVVPRLAEGPDYRLFDQSGQPVTPAELAGQTVLFGFGYTHDPTSTIERTLADMGNLQTAARAAGADLTLALILFDDQRDTPEQRQVFAAKHGLDGWLLLSADALTLKQVIGQGFGVYYEAVSLADLVSTDPVLADRLPAPPGPADYGFLQAERYILVDERNIVRARYRAPLDMDFALRDISLMTREKDSTGAARALNEAAHLFMCYP